MVWTGFVGLNVLRSKLTGILDMRETFSGILDAFPASEHGTQLNSRTCVWARDNR